MDTLSTRSQNTPGLTSDHPDSPSEAPQCSICLEPVSGIAVIQPCKHDCFDFLCLQTWLTTHKTCPLCKQDVKAVQHAFNAGGRYRVLVFPPINRAGDCHDRTFPGQNQRPYSSRRPRGPIENQEAIAGLESRCYVYRHRLFSLHIGSNSISGYEELTPSAFQANEGLRSKAKKWIRRELQVFRFREPEDGPYGRQGQRANHTEFLLGYIVSIMTFMDVKGGRAEELLAEHLGSEYARLFLHELLAWMRSPCQNLVDYDRLVQY